MTNKNWWKKERDEIPKCIDAVVSYWVSNQETRVSNFKDFIEMYENRPLVGVSPYQYISPSSVIDEHFDTFNVVQSMCDTVSAIIAKNKPRPMFITDDGDCTIRKKAMKLTEFCDGVFYKTKTYEKTRDVFLDATIFGTGCLKLYKENNDIKMSRVFPGDLYVDEREAINREPRQIHYRALVHKDVLKSMYPDYEGEIDQCPKADEVGIIQNQLDNEMLWVYESWHLPNADGKDGRHVICIKTACLFDEEWEKDYFPFVFLRWNNRRLGFWGQGLAENLKGIQKRINETLSDIQESIHKTAYPKIFIKEGTSVNPDDLNDEMATTITWSGDTPPEYKSVAAVPPELRQHLEMLYEKAYELAGVSRLSANSKKPADLESGAAIREYNDIESERFILVGQAYEEMFIEISKQIVGLAKDIDKETGGFKVKVLGKSFLKTIDWKDVDLDEDAYVMKIWPVSQLARTPSGRIAQAQELMKLGVLSPGQVANILQFPDLDSAMNLKRAAEDDILKTIERMVEDGKYEAPDPLQDLRLGVEMVTESFLKYRNQNLEEEKLELLRQWIEEAQQMLNEAEAAMAPPPPAQPPIQ